MNVPQKIKSYLSVLYRRHKYRNKTREKIFSNIYHNETWKAPGKGTSVSGSGSDLINTNNLRKQLPEIIKHYHIQSILDIGCGDFKWMKSLDISSIEYIGIDIVPEIMQQNNLLFSSEKVKFNVLDACKDHLPDAQMVILRDCLVHLSLNDIQLLLNNVLKNNAEYLLATTFTGITENKEIITGLWRPINLQIAPFYFPAAELMFSEDKSQYDFNNTNKSMGLWKL